MKLSILQNEEERAKAPTSRKKSVVIASKLNIVKERYDAHGNMVDPRTKRIIKRATN